MTPPPQNYNPRALPAGVRLGDYEVLSVLGCGGFGITYKARNISSGAVVVIKENLPSEVAYRDWNTLDVVPLPKAEARETYKWSLNSFFREAQTLGKLNHRYIVSVYEAFECYNTAYFVMPYIEGVDLQEWVLSLGSYSRAAPYLEQFFLLLLEALDHVHAHSLCHRDVKPTNILITREGLPILIDFGAARDSSSEATRTILATIVFAPVEQLESHGRIGPWTDIYALGATFYRVMTGEDPPLAISRVRSDTCRKLACEQRLLNVHSSRFLAGIDFALMLNEAERPQSCAELGRFITAPQPVSVPVAAPVEEILRPGAVSRTERQASSVSSKERDYVEAEEAESDPFLSRWPLVLSCFLFAGAVFAFVALQNKDGSGTALTVSGLMLAAGMACLVKHGMDKKREQEELTLFLTAYDNESRQVVNSRRIVLGKRDWSIILGRSKRRENTFYLPGTSQATGISRRHAILFYDGGQLYIRNESEKLPMTWNKRPVKYGQTLLVHSSEYGKIGSYTIYFE